MNIDPERYRVVAAIQRDPNLTEKEKFDRAYREVWGVSRRMDIAIRLIFVALVIAGLIVFLLLTK